MILQVLKYTNLIIKNFMLLPHNKYILIYIIYEGCVTNCSNDPGTW